MNHRPKLRPPSPLALPPPVSPTPRPTVQATSMGIPPISRAEPCGTASSSRRRLVGGSCSGDHTRFGREHRRRERAHHCEHERTHGHPQSPDRERAHNHNHDHEHILDPAPAPTDWPTSLPPPSPSPSDMSDLSPASPHTPSPSSPASSAASSPSARRACLPRTRTPPVSPGSLLWPAS